MGLKDIKGTIRGNTHEETFEIAKELTGNDYSF